MFLDSLNTLVTQDLDTDGVVVRISRDAVVLAIRFDVNDRNATLAVVVSALKQEYIGFIRALTYLPNTALGGTIASEHGWSLEDDRLDDAMAEWTRRDYSKGEIDRMGALLVPWWSGAGKPDNLGHAWVVIENWRSSHGLPSNVFQAGLRSRAKRVTREVIVAQRMKRIISVMNKLHREPLMKLSQMQDLGGCRAILPSVNEVDKLYGMYRGDEPLLAGEGYLKCHDYIRAPKDDGYRGIHVVGRYSARIADREAWNGHRIEIQLRSRLQHAFATTVETVTTFTREPLKFGAGPAKWRRFFALMGSALAVREATPLVPGTPIDATELIKELRDVTRTLKVRQRLQGWTDAVKTLPRKNIDGFKWLLLVLNLADNTVKVTGYSNRREASTVIAEIEQSKNEELDAVLVWVGSISDLRAAYPNYYADTREFIEALDHALGSPRKRK